jgi:hypothetical protein
VFGDGRRHDDRPESSLNGVDKDCFLCEHEVSRERNDYALEIISQ